MEPFKTFASVAVPIDIANCDTDQIIPARFLRRGKTIRNIRDFYFTICVSMRTVQRRILFTTRLLIALEESSLPTSIGDAVRRGRTQ